jgi:hypothetical protein
LRVYITDLCPQFGDDLILGLPHLLDLLVLLAVEVVESDFQLIHLESQLTSLLLAALDEPFQFLLFLAFGGLDYFLQFLYLSVFLLKSRLLREIHVQSPEESTFVLETRDQFEVSFDFEL